MNPEIILVGASAGGVDALRVLTANLPRDLGAAVCVVLHTHASSPQLLAQILGNSGDLPVTYAEDEQPIEAGNVYLAPVDRHLLVEPGRMRVVTGPKENRHRPAIDPLFRSGALHYGARAIGVVLTGFLNDGTSGLAAIKRCGGITVVQTPEDADVPEMPQSALRHVAVDHCLPLAGIPPLLVQLVGTPVQGAPNCAPEDLQAEVDIAAMRANGMALNDHLGRRSTLTCPDYDGVLWEVDDDQVLRYRCHLGHAMTAEVLASQQAESVERALWLAIKTLEESGALALRLASRAREKGDEFSEGLFKARAEKAGSRAANLREILIKTATQ